jgi:hypothetical protein
MNTNKIMTSPSCWERVIIGASGFDWPSVDGVPQDRVDGSKRPPSYCGDSL